MKKRTYIYLGIVVLLVAAIYGLLNFYVNCLLAGVGEGEQIDSDEVYVNEIVAPGKEIENIALFGVDSSTGDYNEERSDAMKIISLNKTDKTIAITSLERDVVVYIPGDYEAFGHFNWAYWFGGPKLAIQTINYNLDLDISKYVTFTFGALKDLVDLLGGLEIDLSAAEAAILGLNGAGSHLLDGEDALKYARIRKIDSDFTRMERQNYVIKEVLNNLKDQDVFTIMNIVSSLMDSINTNLSVAEIKSYIVSLLSYDLTNIEQYKEPSGEYADIQTCPGLGGYLVRSYSGMVANLHKNIYKLETYEVSKRVQDLEDEIYRTYGEFAE